MQRNSLLLAAAMIFVPNLSSAEQRDNQLPEKAKSILENAEKLQLYSLSPERLQDVPKNNFHRWKVLGSTTLAKKESNKVLAALKKGIQENKGKVARCFNPRHGIRAVAKGKTVDLVICFECYQIYVYYDKRDKRGGYVLVSRSPTRLFNQILKAAKVPLPKGPSD